MIKRIRPVTRVVKIEGEIRRMMRDAHPEFREFLELQGGWSPLVDVCERDDDLVVEIEVPGLSAKDIVISLQRSRIEIKGLKKEERVSGDLRYLRLEREYGRFRRVVPLPFAVDLDKAKAYLENGVLTVQLKKLKGTKDKDIVVKIQKSQE